LREWILDEREIQFEWNEVKAEANVRKHGVSFELACSVFHDPRILTIADSSHSQHEERWFSVGCAKDGAILSVAYVWSDSDSATKIRIISARKATLTELRLYHEEI
jgi:uncharacterized DUF497 family protein